MITKLIEALSNPTVLMSLIIFLPTVAAFVLLFFPKGQDETMKQFSFITTIIVFALTVWIALPASEPKPKADALGFSLLTGQMQYEFEHDWIPAFDIKYHLGLDGISLPLVVLTSFLSVLAMWASWPIVKHVRAYCILFLLLETGMLGVFMSLDFFLFYVFWEVMLLPMYFLIGVWGGPRREYAAIKFFLFTLVGSVLMLIALLMLYYASVPEPGVERATYLQHHPLGTPGTDGQLAIRADAVSGPFGGLVGILAVLRGLRDQAARRAGAYLATRRARRGPHAHFHDPRRGAAEDGRLRRAPYLLSHLALALDSHLTWMVAIVGVVSMVYGAFAALAQKDFKRLVAYSSVSHMGYVLLGIGVCSATAGNLYDPAAWRMGVSGAMFQMIAHGISSAGMFFLVGVVYDRVHHRDLDRFGGLFQHMPTYAGISMVIFFAALGLPGLCGFIGELLVVLSVWTFSKVLAVISAAVVILTAGYILWTIQRVYLGAEYKGPHAEALRPMSLREIAIAAPLIVMAVVLGVFPKLLLDYTDATVGGFVDRLSPARQAAQLSTDERPIEVVKPQTAAAVETHTAPR